MANYARFFFLVAQEMLDHQVHIGRNLLRWVEEQLTRGKEQFVAKYLFKHLPGITPVTDLMRLSRRTISFVGAPMSTD